MRRRGVAEQRGVALMRLRFLKGDVRTSGERRRPRGAIVAAVLTLGVLASLMVTAVAGAAAVSTTTKGVAVHPRALSGASVAHGAEATARAGSSPRPATPIQGVSWLGGKAAVTTIFSDGSEGSTSPWSVTGNPTWAITTYRAAAGTHSSYCAGSAVAPPGPYFNNMDGWRVAGPFDLSALSAATFQFQMYVDTQVDKDWLWSLVSTNGTDFYGWGESGTSNGWVTRSRDLAAVPTLGNVCGKSQVWIAFRFTSDASIVAEGAYVDEVSVSGSGGGGTAGLVLSADAEVVPYNGSVGLIGAILNAGSGALIPNKSIDVYATQENSLTADLVFLETLSSSTGEYSTRWGGIQKRTYFLTAFAGDTEYPGEIYSNLVKVMARALITPPAVPSTVPANVPITSWGTIKPLHSSSQNHASHTKVIAEHYLGGAWRSVLTIFATKYKNSKSATSYAITLRYAPGRWRVMGVHQDDDHAKSASAWRTFTAR